MDDELDFSGLKAHLERKLFWPQDSIDITPLPGGYSNLSFLLQTPKGKFALRRPPFGDKIAKAHDMVRECRVLEGLHLAGYRKSPKPVFLYEDDHLIGVPFFLMEYIDGFVLRNKIPQGVRFDADDFEKLSKNTLDCLIDLHLLELNQSGLINLGKPEGYVRRQVEGWIDRYRRAKTHELPEMEKTGDWLKAKLPEKENTAFIHNDFKYDNLVLNSENVSEIKAVLDWEMATVGEPLMDLGTSLAYWAEDGDPDILKLFNLSYLPGNLSRKEVIAYYDIRTPFDLSDILFYYVFGLFKVGVIAQQIYRRFAQGYAKDPRFAALVQVVEAAGKKAEKSILTETI
jgi:aminoglycoside phosphotransferase (APT) family kinase protein